MITTKKLVVALRKVPEKKFRIYDLAPQLLDANGKVEQGFKVYGVVGQGIAVNLRVGVYGYFMPVPYAYVFGGKAARGLKGVAKRLTVDFHKAHCNDTREHEEAYNDKGELMSSKTGDRESIGYTQADCDRMRGAALTIHNHPMSGNYEECPAFSYADMRTGAELGVKAQAIVTKNTICTWVKVDESKSFNLNLARDWQNEAVNDFQDLKQRAGIARGTREEATLWNDTLMRYNQRCADAFGYDYEVIVV